MVWRLRDLPELNCLEPDQRAAVLRQVPWQRQLGLWLYAMIAASFVGLVAMIIAAEVYRGPWLAAVFAAAWLGASLVFYQLILKRIHHAMRRELAAAFPGRPPFCFVCGYDLRGHTQTICPECGHRDRPATRPASAMRTLGRITGKYVIAPRRR